MPDPKKRPPSKRPTDIVETAEMPVVRAADFRHIYTDIATISSAPDYTLMIAFRQYVYSATQELVCEERAVVSMTIGHAKRLAAALLRQIEKHEQAYGPTPVQE